MKRSGRRAGPQMPNDEGFHSMSPLRARSGMRRASRGKRLLQLRPGQRGAHAEVDAGAEGHLRRAALPSDVEDVGLLEGLGVAVGPDQRGGHERPPREQDVAVHDVLGGEARGAAHRTEVAHGLLDGPGRELRALGQQGPLVGVLGEERHGAGQLVAGGVGAGHEDRLGEHRHLVGRQPVTRLLDRDEVAQQVVTGIGAALGDHVVHVRRELLVRPLDQREVLGQVVVEDAEDVRRPAREQLPVLGRRTEELADDRDRVRLAHVGDQLALALPDHAVDELADHGLHGGAEPVGRGRRERRGDEAAQPGMALALHGEDGLAALAAGSRSSGTRGPAQ